MQIRAAQQNEELRQVWMNKITSYNANQLIVVDESAADERASNRKRGWAPIGVTPQAKRLFVRSERWSILPAYTVDGFITWEIVHGSFTWDLFDDFVENKVLPLCNPFPLEKSVLIMDNATVHRSQVFPHYLGYF